MPMILCHYLWKLEVPKLAPNFSIELNSQGENEIVYLSDLSKSGTFINNSKVGHGKSKMVTTQA